MEWLGASGFIFRAMSGRGWDGRIHALRDLRTMEPVPTHDRFIDLKAKGLTEERIAECVAVSRTTVQTHIRKAKEGGEPIVKKFPAVIGVDR